MSPYCLKCKNADPNKFVWRGKLDTGNPRFKCKVCGKWGNTGHIRHKRSARILLLDIETLPMEVYVWNPKQEYIQPNMVIKDWSIACFAAKWLFEPEIMGKSVSAQEAFERTEKSILGDVWKLMSEADLIITQNGINFDIRKLNTKFVINKFPPPSRFLNVDTLKTAQSVFGFSYNRLDELGQKFGIGKKMEMNFQDWRNCLTNDKSAEKALAHQLEYCKRDVAPLLEDVYLAMLPYMTNHPNMNIYTNHDKDVCPKCESIDLNWSEKPYATPQGLWSSFRCGACGSIGRGTKAEHNIKRVSIR